MKLTKKQISLGALAAVAIVAIPVATVVSCGSKESKKAKTNTSTSTQQGGNQAGNKSGNKSGNQAGNKSGNKSTTTPIYKKGIGYDESKGALIIDTRVLTKAAMPNLDALVTKVQNEVLVNGAKGSQGLVQGSFPQGKFKFDAKEFKKPIADKIAKDGKVKIILNTKDGKTTEQTLTAYELTNTMSSLGALAVGIPTAIGQVIKTQGTKVFIEDYKFQDGKTWRDHLKAGKLDAKTSNTGAAGNLGKKIAYTDAKSVKEIKTKYDFFHAMDQAIDIVAVSLTQTGAHIILPELKADKTPGKALNKTYILEHTLATKLLIDLYDAGIIQASNVPAAKELEEYAKKNPTILK